MRTEITWHQLVEWQQYYAVEPFGNERADLRSAMAGVTVANEIRAIASGLAGKDLGAIQVKDLMIDTLAKDKRARDRKNRLQSQARDDDRAAAENYYRLWSKSIREKQVNEQKSDQSSKPKAKPKSKPRTRSRQSLRP